VHARVLQELREWIPLHTTFQVQDEIASPILGRDGNREFLFLLRFRAQVV
jgi:23S rRNA (cytidine1920-2'-O)/16S rRNA (cytidine1409-2'-O)-methyltransferase